MWMMPLHLHVNQKSDYDDDGLFIGCIGTHPHGPYVTSQCYIKVLSSSNVASQHIQELLGINIRIRPKFYY